MKTAGSEIGREAVARVEMTVLAIGVGCEDEGAAHRGTVVRLSRGLLLVDGKGTGRHGEKRQSVQRQSGAGQNRASLDRGLAADRGLTTDSDGRTVM